MFLYPGFESVNSLKDVAPGRYASVCSVYVNSPRTEMAVLIQYTLESEKAPSIAELQLLDVGGEVVRFVDFVKMPDNSWRDSYGLRADSMKLLLPPEIISYTFHEEFSSGTQIVEVQ